MEAKTFDTYSSAVSYLRERGAYKRTGGFGLTEYWRAGTHCAHLEFTPGEASPYILTFME